MLLAHQLEQLEALHGGAYGWALLCCARDREQAADVLQTSYARIISGQASFAGRSDLRSFLFGVVRRVALEDQRSRRRAANVEHMVHMDPGERVTAPSPSSELELGELQARLRAALEDLPMRQREVLHLHFYEGLSLQAAADVLGIGLGSARQHYERGKAALRSRCESLREAAHPRAQRTGR